MYSGSNFDRSEKQRLRAAVSGGLNTAASDLMTPLEDSPNMNNVQVDSDGTIRKRKGYKVIGYYDSASNTYLEGGFLIPIKTSSGRPMLIRRAGTSVAIEVKEDSGDWTTQLTLSNIFSTNSSLDRFSWIKLTEPLYDRIILVNENHVPIQISYTSMKIEGYSKAGSGIAWGAFETSVAFAGSSSGTLIALIDGVLDTVSGVVNSYGVFDNSLSFDTANSYPAGTYDVELIFISYQWWAESLILRGDQLVQTVVQGVSTKTISVPSILLNGIESYTDYKYPLLPMSSTNYDAVFTFSNTPTTSSQYSYSDGSLSDGTTRPRPSPYYIAFGAAPSSARNVVISRGYYLPFTGGMVSQDTGDIAVVPYRGSNEFARYTTAPPSEGGAGVGVANGGYHLRIQSNYGVSTATTTNRVPRYVTLDATRSADGGLLKVSADDTYFVISTDETTLESSGYLGTGASSSDIPAWLKSLGRESPVIMTNGYAYPIGGISHFSDYRRGSFPHVIGTLQGRVVLGGFEDQPLTLVFSNPYDSDVPGYFANNFDTVYTPVSAISPFDITLPGGNNDSITSMVEFNDSLFVFTKHRLYRIHNNGELVDFSNVKYTVVADIGCLNFNSAALTDQYPVFLSTSGVYAVVPSDTSSGYAITELSLKVRNLVRSKATRLTNSGFILFDSGRSELYVGLSEDGITDRCGILLVFNTQLNVWYKYTRLGGSGFGSYAGAVVYDTREESDQSLPSIMLTGYYDSVNLNPYTPDDDKMMIMELNYDCPFDVHEVLTTGITTPYTTNLHKIETTATTVSGLREYTPDSFSQFGEISFSMSPIIGFEDIEIELNNVVQTFNEDYVKTVNNSIYFTSSPSPFLSIEMRPKIRYEGALYHPVGIRVNGKVLMPDEYEVTVLGDNYRITSITPAIDGNDIVEIGYIFPAWYVTPTFNAETLAVKKVKNYIGYFQNNLNDVWRHYESYPATSDVGYRKTPLSVNMAVIFSNEGDGLLQEELYNDVTPSDQPLNQQRKDYSRITVPIIGLGYNYSVVHHNYSPTSFKLAGYEIDVVAKKGKGYSRSEEGLN